MDVIDVVPKLCSIQDKLLRLSEPKLYMLLNQQLRCHNMNGFEWLRKTKEQQPTITCAENSLLPLSYQSILQSTDEFSMENLNIRHRNLVKILAAISGVDYQGNDFKALVYEFMENGSLEDWLHPSVDVAHALEYLHHHCKTTIIHCDLKPSNILLDEETVAHISDFGLAKIISADMLNLSAKKSNSLGLRGTIGYALPGDISPSSNSLANDRHLLYLNSILKIGLACSSDSPSERIDMSDVVTKLCSIRNKLHQTQLCQQVQIKYVAQSTGIKSKK
ncbi:hypothetical protein F3Y22_tig00110704pilonHSYRG00050 [Hibiscus syriacus]|uniref:Protein kinase domain-containing protein n=1 Tax=Hibiscus syriacus TaxID=106335 RepID=A0A6A2ZWG0_HIBSY|nr:hypothetical protein F3Y22_tig00110704pilonHSYRG00050 [Hibiscus syriacus]